MADRNGMDETLSALMDDEAAELEVRRALKAVSEDPERRATWRRYQLAAAAMKRDLPPQMVDLSDRIATAIDREAPPRPSARRWLKPLGRVAVAASVAAVAVFGVQNYQPGPPAGGGQQPDLASGDGDERASGSAQFQLPAGYDLPPVSARAAGSFSGGVESSPQPVRQQQGALPSRAERQAIQGYLNTMMERHVENAAHASSSQGLMPLARLPQEVDNGR